MTSNNQNNAPTGLYVLSGFVILLILDILFDLLTSPSSWSVIISTIILIPLYTYLGIGIIRAWPKARNTYIVMAILLFAGTIIQIITQVIIKGQGLAVASIQ